MPAKVDVWTPAIEREHRKLLKACGRARRGLREFLRPHELDFRRVQKEAWDKFERARAAAYKVYAAEISPARRKLKDAQARATLLGQPNDRRQKKRERALRACREFLDTKGYICLHRLLHSKSSPPRLFDDDISDSTLGRALRELVKEMSLTSFVARRSTGRGRPIEVYGDRELARPYLESVGLVLDDVLWFRSPCLEDGQCPRTDNEPCPPRENQRT